MWFASRSRHRAAGIAFSLALATFSGRVLDTTTGQPLAHVRVSAGAARAVTDARGRFVLRGLPLGNVTLTLESADVPVQRVTTHVTRGTARNDVRACSTTLDYHCGNHDSESGGQGGAG